MKKLYIAYPTSGTYSNKFGYSVINLVGYMMTADPVPDVQFQVGFAEGANWIENRETIVENAIKGGFTHVVFLDDDMQFAPDVLVSMLQRDVDVVCCNYLVKEWPPETWVAMGMDGQRMATTADKAGLEEALGCGFGVSIIATDVFKSIPQPWFMPLWNPDTKRYSTEDMPFFARARKAGHRVWVDHDASKRVAHIGRFRWDWTMWRSESDGRG